LARQSDPDMPKTKFLSNYLIDPEKPDNASTGKKQAHEMRGVLLTVLFFLVLSKSAGELKKIMGERTLSEYVKICDITDV